MKILVRPLKKSDPDLTNLKGADPDPMYNISYFLSVLITAPFWNFFLLKFILL